VTLPFCPELPFLCKNNQIYGHFEENREEGRGNREEGIGSREEGRRLMKIAALGVKISNVGNRNFQRRKREFPTLDFGFPYVGFRRAVQRDIGLGTSDVLRASWDAGTLGLCVSVAPGERGEAEALAEAESEV